MERATRSAREMAVLEANALALGGTLEGLLEQAGRAVAEEAARRLPAPPARVSIVAGTGNNGGDGTCAAHYHLEHGHAPEVWMPRSPEEIRSPAARRCFDRIADRVPVHLGAPDRTALAGSSLAIDAMLGTGQSGPLRGPYAEAAAALNASGVPVLSVDEPSGLGTPGAVRPALTVTFTFRKEGMDPTNSGEIVLREVGIPPAAWEEVGPGEFLWAPEVPRSGRSGRVVVIGGGPFAGAPALAALAALRAGAERATVLCPRAVVESVRGYSPDLVVVPVGEVVLGPAEVPAVLEELGRQRVDALAVGMGAGRATGTVEALKEVLARWSIRSPCVVDADGLEAARRLDRPPDAPALVLTPNSGELLRLAGRSGELAMEERLAAAGQLARDGRCTLLAKGEVDLITDGERAYRNRHHHPAAAVAGAGDVLTGVVAALLAQGVPALPAARLAAYWVGRAGLELVARSGTGVLATDLLGALPAAGVDGLRRVGRTGPRAAQA